jgi:tRNA(Ile2) C34 agmatinyltransferase TiaS
MKKIVENLTCPFCKKTIIDKDLKHFKCTKCKKSFKVKI